MFEQSDKKIKTCATICFIGGIVVTFIFAIYCFAYNQALVGFLTLIEGGFVSYVGGLLLTGFANIIENTNNLKPGKISAAYEKLTDEELKEKYLSGEINGDVYLNLIKNR